MLGPTSNNLISRIKFKDILSIFQIKPFLTDIEHSIKKDASLLIMLNFTVLDHNSKNLSDQLHL